MTRPSELFVVFGAMGATAALVPAVLPQLGATLHRSVLEAVPVLFGGLLVGVLLSALAAHVVGVGGAIRAGAIMQFVGLGLLAASSAVWMVILAAGIAGVGFGLAESAANSLARERGGVGIARLLGWLTATVAIVATLAPLLVVVAGAEGFRVVLGGAAVAQLVAAALVRDGREHRVPSGRVVPRPRLVLVAMAMFLYVGVESSLSGFSAATVGATLEVSTTVAAFGTSAFWSLMTLGRFAGAALLGSPGREIPLSVGSLALVAVSLGFSFVVEAPALKLVLLAVAVVGCGPCYGALIAAGAVGGAVLPALVIALGGLRGGSWLAAAAAALAGVAVAVAGVPPRQGAAT